MTPSIRALIVDSERHARNHADPQPLFIPLGFPERADPEVRELELYGDRQFCGVVATTSKAGTIAALPHDSDQPQQLFSLRVSPYPAATKKPNKSLLAIAARCVFNGCFHIGSFQCFQSGALGSDARAIYSPKQLSAAFSVRCACSMQSRSRAISSAAFSRWSISEMFDRMSLMARSQMPATSSHSRGLP